MRQDRRLSGPANAVMVGEAGIRRKRHSEEGLRNSAPPLLAVFCGAMQRYLPFSDRFWLLSLACFVSASRVCHLLRPTARRSIMHFLLSNLSDCAHPSNIKVSLVCATRRPASSQHHHLPSLPPSCATRSGTPFCTLLFLIFSALLLAR